MEVFFIDEAREEKVTVAVITTDGLREYYIEFQDDCDVCDEFAPIYSVFESVCSWCFGEICWTDIHRLSTDSVTEAIHEVMRLIAEYNKPPIDHWATAWAECQKRNAGFYD